MATGQQKLIVLVGAVVASSLLHWIPLEEGTLYKPYSDAGFGPGVITYCSGVTYPPPIKGHTYTKEECEEIDNEAIYKHTKAFLSCVKVPVTNGQIVAGGLLFYNVGTSCNKTYIKRLNNGDGKEACKGILLYKYVHRKNKRTGKMDTIDCSIRSNNCYGVFKRHILEYNLCTETIPLLGDT